MQQRVVGRAMMAQRAVGGSGKSEASLVSVMMEVARSKC